MGPARLGQVVRVGRLATTAVSARLPQLRMSAAEMLRGPDHTAILGGGR